MHFSQPIYFVHNGQFSAIGETGRTAYFMSKDAAAGIAKALTDTQPCGWVVDSFDRLNEFFFDLDKPSIADVVDLISNADQFPNFND